MSEWWTYTIGSFLLFSPRTYVRLVELYNIAIWPMQIVFVGLGIAMLLLLRTRQRWQGRAIALSLAACWIWVACSFHWHWYATINWAATYFAAAFVIEAILLAALGVLGNRFRRLARDSLALHSGVALYLFAFIGYPIVDLLADRSWRELEVFGAAPDPTAVATIGVVLLAGNGFSWVLLVVPVLWCATSAALLAAMGSPQAWTMLGAGLLGLVAGCRWRRFAPRQAART